MQQQKNDLIVAAAALAKSSPTQWQYFLKALTAFADAHKDNLVNSPVETLQITQGTTRAITGFTVIMKDCIETAEAIKAGNKGK